MNLVVWHAPVLFDETLRNQTLHDLEHATFFFTGLLFWAQVFDSPPFRARLDWLQRVAYLIAAMLVGWVIAVVLAFASAPLYAPYAAIVNRPGGLSALNDQRLAAGVMWAAGPSSARHSRIVAFRSSVATPQTGPPPLDWLNAPSTMATGEAGLLPASRRNHLFTTISARDETTRAPGL